MTQRVDYAPVSNLCGLELTNQTSDKIVSSSPNLKLMVFSYDEAEQQFSYAEEVALLTTVGAKALNLAFLKNLGYVDVPDFSAVSSKVFKGVVAWDQTLKSMREALCFEMGKYNAVHDKAGHEKKVFQMASLLRDYVRKMALPQELVQQARVLYDHVSEGGKKSIAVRSSAKAEDLPGASFAGLYDSYLNIRDYPAFLEALKKNWASSFNDRAVQYYMQKGVEPKDVYMSSVIMQLVDGELSGTVFTTDITTGYNGVHVMVSNGLEAVVGGDVSADSYLFHPDNFTVLKQVKGSKEFKYIPSEDGSGMVKVALDAQESQRYCLSSDKAKDLAKLVARIGADYQQVSQGPVDTEYVIDKQGKIFLVQIRPATNDGASEVDDLNFAELAGKPKIIATGKHSVFGVKCGKVKIVEDFHSLERGEIEIDPEDIVVAVRTENEWTQYLTQFSGIISTEGNPTSHPVLISREKNVPCLVGVPNAIGKFREYDGQWVTLDGFRKCVYPGRLPLKKVSISEIKDAFAPVSEEKLQPEEEMVKDLFAKGFMREEDGKKWITGINAQFSGALKDMVANAYSLREKVINDSGISQPVQLRTEQKIFHTEDSQTTGKVYDHWWVAHEEQLKVCMGMNLQNFSAFYRNKGQLMRQLVDVCQAFDLTIDSWKKVRSTYEEVTAYQLLGFLERYPLIHQTYEKAKNAAIPRLFYEEYVASVPEFEFEEDVAFLNDTKVLAKELADKKVDLDSLSLVSVQVEDPEFYKKLVHFSRQYKYSKDEDWLQAPPVDKAFVKVVNQAKSKDFDLVHKALGKDPDIEFFTDMPELREAMRLSIVKKLQQNDIHHVRSRAQWYLRDKLLMLGELLQTKGILNKSQEILSLKLSNLEQYIELYGKEVV